MLLVVVRLVLRRKATATGAWVIGDWRKRRKEAASCVRWRSGKC